MHLFKIFLRLTLFFTLSWAHPTFAKTHVYLLESKLQNTSPFIPEWSIPGSVLTHLGLRFKDTDSHEMTECHFTDKGLIVLRNQTYTSSYIKEDELITLNQGIENYVLNCQKWAENKRYYFGEQDCWTMVSDFLQLHKIDIPDFLKRRFRTRKFFWPVPFVKILKERQKHKKSPRAVFLETLNELLAMPG